MSKKKSKTKEVSTKQKKKIIIPGNNTKRKMPPEELKAYLRENNRGCGAHKNKKKYNRKRDKKIPKPTDSN